MNNFYSTLIPAPMFLKFTSLFLACLCFISSCKREEDSPKALGNFKQIHCNGGVNIKFIQGATNEVISTTLADSEYNTGSYTLNINASGGQITIAVNDLDLVWLNGSHITTEGTLNLQDLRFYTNASDVTMNDIHVADTIYGDFNNTGTIHFSGSTPFLHLNLINTARLEAFDLLADSVDIYQGATVDAQIYASLLLRGGIASSGDVYYKGNPAVLDTASMGSGIFIPQ